MHGQPLNPDHDRNAEYNHMANGWGIGYSSAQRERMMAHKAPPLPRWSTWYEWWPVYGLCRKVWGNESTEWYARRRA